MKKEEFINKWFDDTDIEPSEIEYYKGLMRIDVDKMINAVLPQANVIKPVCEFHGERQYYMEEDNTRRCSLCKEIM